MTVYWHFPVLWVEMQSVITDTWNVMSNVWNWDASLVWKFVWGPDLMVFIVDRGWVNHMWVEETKSVKMFSGELKWFSMVRLMWHRRRISLFHTLVFQTETLHVNTTNSWMEHRISRRSYLHIVKHLKAQLSPSSSLVFVGRASPWTVAAFVSLRSSWK